MSHVDYALQIDVCSGSKFEIWAEIVGTVGGRTDVLELIVPDSSENLALHINGYNVLSHTRYAIEASIY